jgi:hypothetical protein
MSPEKLGIYVAFLAVALSIVGNFMVYYFWDLVGSNIKEDHIGKHILGIISTILFLIFFGLFVNILSQLQ